MPGKSTKHIHIGYLPPTARLRAYRASATGNIATPPNSDYGPVSYATLNDAKLALNAPTNANYVMWTFGNAMLESVFASLATNDILVLPERAEPYYIDSSNGFMASGVTGIDGANPNSTPLPFRKDGSIVPIVSNSRMWFGMCRSRRGILGLGPGAVIEPSPSSFTASPQPILQNQDAGNQFQTIYFSGGATQPMNGVAHKLIDYDTPNPFFANFTMRSRDFGGVAYHAISGTAQGTLLTVKQVHFDEAWRSHHGVPNGEAGALAMGGPYLFENLDMTSPSDGYQGGSPLMWNNTSGGTARHIRSSGTKGGMFTLWRAGGTHTFEDMHISAGQTAFNVEEIQPNFYLNWTGGSISVGLGFTGNKFHFAMNPSGGAPHINLSGVTVSPNAYTPNALTLSVYTTSGVAKRSWITCDTMPISCVPSSMWIA